MNKIDEAGANIQSYDMNSFTGKWLHWESIDDDSTVHLWLPGVILGNLCVTEIHNEDYASLERARSRDWPTISPRE